MTFIIFVSTYSPPIYDPLYARDMDRRDPDLIEAMKRPAEEGRADLITALLKFLELTKAAAQRNLSILTFQIHVLKNFLVFTRTIR